MTNEEKNLAKMKRLFDLMDDDALTKEEFVKSFENVLSLIGKVEKRNIEEIDAIKKQLNSLFNELRDGTSSRFEKEKNDLLDRFKNSVSSLELSFKKKIDEVDQKIIEVKDGEDADEKRVIETVLSRVPPQIVDKPENIRDKLETLKGDERLDLSAIKGLEERIREIPERPTRSIFAARQRIILVDLSSQLDGSTKTFNIGFTHFGIISVQGSSAPFGAWRPTTDYLEVGNSIVFDPTNVDAASALAAGQSLVIKVLK